LGIQSHYESKHVWIFVKHHCFPCNPPEIIDELACLFCTTCADFHSPSVTSGSHIPSSPCCTRDSGAPVLPRDLGKHLKSIHVTASAQLVSLQPILFCFAQSQLLSISAAHGDLESVRCLLTEKRVELPTEPTDDNPAVVAAHFGHTEVVQELLESLAGKSQQGSSLPPLRGPSS
jgi:hypothetical protein